MSDKKPKEIKKSVDSDDVWIKIETTVSANASLSPISAKRNVKKIFLIKNSDIASIDTHVLPERYDVTVYLVIQTKSGKEYNLSEEEGERFLKVFEMINCVTQI